MTPAATALTRDTERRPMARAEKVAAVAELTERFRSSAGAVLTEYRGLTVAQLERAAQVARRARHVRRGEEHADQDRGHRRGRGAEQLDRLLTGPSAIAFVERRRGRGGQGPARLRPGEPAAGDQGRRPRRQGADARRDRQAGRPRVARGAAGQAGRRHEGVHGAARRPRSPRCPPRWRRLAEALRRQASRAEEARRRGPARRRSRSAADGARPKTRRQPTAADERTAVRPTD